MKKYIRIIIFSVVLQIPFCCYGYDSITVYETIIREHQLLKHKVSVNENLLKEQQQSVLLLSDSIKKTSERIGTITKDIQENFARVESLLVMSKEKQEKTDKTILLLCFILLPIILLMSYFAFKIAKKSRVLSSKVDRLRLMSENDYSWQELNSSLLNLIENQKCNKNIEELENLAKKEPTNQQFDAIKTLEELRKECRELNVLRNLSHYLDNSRAWLYWFSRDPEDARYIYRIEESTKIVEFVLSNLIDVINDDLSKYDDNHSLSQLDLLVGHLKWAKSFFDVIDDMFMDKEYREKRFIPNKNSHAELLDKYSKLLSDLKAGKIRFITSEQAKNLEGHELRMKEIDKKIRNDIVKVLLIGCSLISFVIALINCISSM